MASRDRVAAGYGTGTEMKAGARAAPAAKTLNARPLCGVCNKPVEEFTEEEDGFGSEVVFTARCHGKRERVRVDIAQAKGINFGVAFAPAQARLPAPPEFAGNGDGIRRFRRLSGLPEE
jgi:hypothetical protein